MAEDQLRSLVDGIRARLQAELDAQLGTVAESHDRALAELRTTTEAEADRRSADALEAARAEWDVRLQSEIQAARSEVERTMVAESMRARLESEQAAAEAASEARRALEQAVAAERKRAEEEIARVRNDDEVLRKQLEEFTHLKSNEDERRKRAEEEFAHLKAQAEELRQRADDDIARLQAEREEIRQRADRELEQARAALAAERANATRAFADERNAPAASSSFAVTTAEILDAIRAIDNSTSLSAALAAVTRAAASQAPRAAMFVVDGSELREWPVTGIAGIDAGRIRVDGREAGFLSDVLRRGESVTIGQTGGTPPEFARLSPGRSAIAVPFTLGGQPVAVLYADEGNNGQPSRPWRDTIQILGRHASAFLAYLTAVKTVQAMQLLGAGPSAQSGAVTEDEAQSARRYARLLVSEIKLYNEGAVRVGRQRRDLMRRLKPEIDRARRLYEERVPVSTHARDVYFHEELVQTLADGDQSLLD